MHDSLIKWLLTTTRAGIAVKLDNGVKRCFVLYSPTADSRLPVSELYGQRPKFSPLERSFFILLFFKVKKRSRSIGGK
jgi:hypothetical protein